MELSNTLDLREPPLDCSSPVPSPEKREVKNKVLLHCCKLCPDKPFTLSGLSRTRPANPSVERHAQKHHSGINYRNLTKRWGRRVYYTDGSAENVPFPKERNTDGEHDMEARNYQEALNEHTNQRDTGIHWAAQHDAYDDSLMPRFHLEARGLKNDIVNSSPLHGWCSDFDVAPNHGIYHSHIKGTQELGPPSQYPELPLLDLWGAQPECSDTKTASNHDERANPNCFKTFDDTQSIGIRPSNPVNPYGMSAQDTQALTSGFEYADQNPHFNVRMVQDQAQPENVNPMQQFITSSMGPCERCCRSNGLQAYDTGKGMNEVVQQQAQPTSMSSECLPGDDLGRFQDYGCSTFGSITGPMLPMFVYNQVQHSEAQLPSRQTAFGQEYTGPQYCTPKKGRRSSSQTPSSTQTVYHTPIQSIDPAIIDSSTPTSATYSPSKRLRSSSDKEGRRSETSQLVTPTPSQGKRLKASSKGSTTRSQLEKLQSVCSTPSRPQSMISISSSNDLAGGISQQSIVSSTPLRHRACGPVVFPLTPFHQMHPLDRAALRGNQGEKVARLSRMAFFGHGEKHSTHPRTREKQLIDMVNYLIVQREWYQVKDTGEKSSTSSSEVGN